MKTNFLFTILALAICSGNSQKITELPVQPAMPPVIVYKTHHDYSDKVPVTLSPDKKRVVSYPAPGDIYYNGKLAYPTPLSGGYYLDNRGIGPNSAFTKYTYEEYSKLSQAPSLDELYQSVIDKDPFTVIYSVNPATGRDIDKINEAIKKKDFAGWKVLKKSKNHNSRNVYGCIRTVRGNTAISSLY